MPGIEVALHSCLGGSGGSQFVEDENRGRQNGFLLMSPAVGLGQIQQSG